MTPLRRSPAAATVALFIAIASFGTGCQFTYLEGSSREFQRYAKAAGPHADLSQARFIFDDFGTLNSHAMETSAMPWKLYSTALLISEAKKQGLPFNEESVFKLMQSYGFIRADRIGNWDASRSPEPALIAPLGLQRVVARGHLPGLNVEISNINCSTCHAGLMYDSQGNPTRTAWLGTPNTSLNVDGFVDAVYRGLTLGAKDTDWFKSKIEETYPKMTRGEKFTIRRLLMSQFKKEMAKLKKTRDAALPYAIGTPGNSNGVAAFKYQLGVLDPNKFHAEESEAVSIPDLGNRAFRSSLLADGVYAPRGEDERFREITREEASSSRLTGPLAGIATYFLVPTAGSTFQNAEDVIPRVSQALQFISRYQPQKFPGAFDAVKSERGAHAYSNRCARCHGTYSPGSTLSDAPRLMSFPNALIPLGTIQTDGARLNSVTPQMIRAVMDNPKNSFNRHATAEQTGGYVAPLLSGLWASAPYLHNGSVPTLWHLMHPEQRPARFQIGGHSLDFDKMGVAGHLSDDGGSYIYPMDYRPWSTPVLYDTAALGNSNRGHEWPFNRMSEDEKSDLLEYLKLL